MTLGIDVNLTNTQSTAATSIVSTAFSTKQGNELVLALISNSDTTNIAVSGGGLTWTQLQKQDAQPADNGIIYYGFASSILSSVQITASSTGSQQWVMTILTFTGVDLTGSNGSGAIGANTGGGNSGTTAPTLSVTTTRNNSWVFGAFGYGSNTALVAGSNQTIFGQIGDTINGGRESTTQQNAPTTPSGTSVTLNMTNSGSAWNGAIVEILPSLANPAGSMALLGVGA